MYQCIKRLRDISGSEPNKRVSIRLPSVRHSNSPPRVHHTRERSESTSQIQRNLYAPVSGRLACTFRYQRAMSSRHTKSAKFSKRSGLASEFREIGAASKSKAGFSWVQLRSSKGSCLSYSKKSSKINPFHRVFQQKIIHNSQNPHVFHRSSGQLRKDNSPRKTSYQTLPMASEKTLEVPRDIGKTNSNNSNLCKASKMVGVPFKYFERVPPPSLRAQSVSVHRCFNQRLGSSSRGPKNPGPLVRSREDTPCQSTRAQSCILGSKTLRARVNTKSRLDLFRQLFSGSLSEQTRRHKVMGNDPNDMEDLFLVQPQRNPGPVPTRPRFTQRDCRLLVKGRQDHPDRMVPTPCSFPANMSDLASARGRHVCNLPQSQAQKVHFTNPRPKGLEGGLFESTLGPARQICLLPHRHPPSTGPKDVDLSVSDDCDSSRMARDGLVLGPHRAVNQATPQPTPVEVPVETASQQVPSQEPGISQSSCLESGFPERQTPRFSSSVETRVKAPQRKSSRAVYTARWTIFRTWCTENQVDVSLSPIPRLPALSV